MAQEFSTLIQKYARGQVKATEVVSYFIDNAPPYVPAEDPEDSTFHDTSWETVVAAWSGDELTDEQYDDLRAALETALETTA